NVLDTNQSFEWLCNKAAMDGKPVRHVIYYYHYFNVFTSFISQINKYAWNNSSWDEYKIFKQSATCSGRTNSRESTEERERREKDRNKRSAIESNEEMSIRRTRETIEQQLQQVNVTFEYMDTLNRIALIKVIVVLAFNHWTTITINKYDIP
ncbi:hypothetical protein RFI_29606, partial [Reticulomyxa filosa]